MTVARLKAEMPASEFTQWLGYFKLKAKREEARNLERERERGMQAQRTRKIGGGRRR